MNGMPLFFLHFPRTAGTTVDDIFYNNYQHEQILKIYSKEEYEKYRYLTLEDLSSIKYITGHLLLPKLNPPQIYGMNVRAFTILRDPVKRLYSEYIFLKTWDQQHLYNYLNENKISFTEYIRSNEKILQYRGKNFMTRCLSGVGLDNANINTALQAAKYNLENNFISFGLQERFMESMLLLDRKANLKNILHQKRNALKYAASVETLSEAEIDIVKEYNQADIELYAYACDIFDKRIKNEGALFQRELKNFEYINSKYQNISNLLDDRSHEKKGTDAIILPKDTN